jgi:hypothetical protein
MLLDEAKEWKYVGSETTCKTDDKTKDETRNKQNEKDDLGPVISTENWIVTLAPPIPFTSPKVKLCHRRCRRPQSGWGWKMSLQNDLQGNFAIRTPNGD